jgi:hypothetical protein
VGDDKTTTIIVRDDKQDDISHLSSRCQDLSVYHRDYFVPSKPKVTSYDELPNAVEEKVWIANESHCFAKRFHIFPLSIRKTMKCIH